MPNEGSTLCLGCGKIMVVLEPGFHYHPLCIPTFTPIPGMKGMSFFELEIRDDLVDIIRWAQNNSDRSQQVALGASEVGQECDRRLAYRMAAVPEVNVTMDPWPAIVGTAVHGWMEDAVNRYQQVHGIDDWATEMEVWASDLVKGHTDLYDKRRFAVLDYKFPSPDNFRKLKADGPSVQYQVQVQLYGLGHVRAGRRVDRVGLVVASRSGWLKDLWVWTVPFDQAAAEAALQRIYTLGGSLLASLENVGGQAYADVPASASRLCTWCPWFNRDLSKASERGCPGYKAS